LPKKELENALTGEKTESIQLSLLEWANKKIVNEKETPASNLKINYLSYSQLQTFEMCPLHYKLKYI